MKKSIIIVAIILTIIATLPFIGNSVLKAIIDENISRVNGSELFISKDKIESSYLSTSRHFEFTHKDIEGITFAADLVYSNLPFAREVSLDIYPITPKYDFIFLHINYNYLNQKFKAYIKDFKHIIKLKDTNELEIELKKFTFNGEGGLGTNRELSVNIKELNMQTSDKNKAVSLELKKLKISTKLEIEKNILSIKSSSFIKSVSLNSQELNLDIKNFNLEYLIAGIQKDSYYKLLNASTQRSVEDLLISIVSKGLSLKISDFSTKKIVLNKKENLKGFKISSQVDIKKDEFLKSKLQLSPLLAIPNIDIKTKMKFSKEIYQKLRDNKPISSTMLSYAKTDKHNVMFDISFIKGSLIVNDKVVY